SFEGLVQQEAAFAIARDLTLDSKWQHDDLVRFCQLFGPLESDSNNDATGPESLLFNYKLFIDFTFFPIERQPQRLRLKHQIATTGFLQVFPGELLSDVFAASMPRITTQRNKKGMTVVATRIGGADWSGQANDDSAIAKSSQVIVQLRMAVNTLRLFVHPNITYYLTTVQSDDALYLVHEAHESCTLKTILESFGVMKEPTIRRYLIQLLQALQYLHAHGIVHGNLSTQTVNIDSYGLLKVSEFGLASYLDQLSVQPRPEIIDGNDCDWTRQYPPPEIAKGASGCSMKSDM
uniref:Protein kinase domain-containing protein n=1 Tax=Globisporangium ultimum (strain ATCC 200006 / CBS 805.95 / DAOM BR144) TaxID=431595 RepID=K3WNI0_GLOUD